MANLGLKRIGLGLALMLVGVGAHAGQTDASELQSGTKYSRYRIGVDVSATNAGAPSTSGGSATAAPIFKFSRVPRTIRLVATNSDTQLATGTSQTFGSVVDANTNGKATCVRVTAQERSSKTQLTLSYAIMGQNDTIDPCTQKAPVGPVVDLTAAQKDPLAGWSHTYWKLSCKPKPCHWVKVTCEHAGGWD